MRNGAAERRRRGSDAVDEVQLNTLYVMTEGSYLHREGETVMVEKDKAAVLRVPIHMLEGVVCFGRVMASPQLMGLCAERGVALSFMTGNGRLVARVDSPGSGSVAVRRAHHRRADDAAFALALARSIVAGKIQSQRQNLLRSARDLSENGEAQRLRGASDSLGQSLDGLERGATLDEIRGREGEASKLYFEHFSLMTPEAPAELRFDGRSRRPPTDPVNALLSFLYGMVTNDCAAAVAAVGLDASLGFLHADRPGRPSLALDLVEEFRAPLADRLALTMINRKQLGPDDFVTRPGGAVEMTEAARKRVVAAYQERKQERREHPYVEKTAPIGRFPFLQARILARHLRGEIDRYVPVLFK